MTLVPGAMPRPGVGAGSGVLHWSAWEPSAVGGAGIGDQLLHWGCAALHASQAGEASDRRHHLQHLSYPSPWHHPCGPPRDTIPSARVLLACVCPQRLPSSCRRALPVKPSAHLPPVPPRALGTPARGSGFPGS